jgi:transcriptional regulator with XRE-family HTH domain
MCNATLIDELRRRHDIKSDAALARELDINPCQISKLRAGGPLGNSVILRIHEYLGVPVKEIRGLAAQAAEQREEVDAET